MNNTYKIRGNRWNKKNTWYQWDTEHRFPHFEEKGDSKEWTIQAPSITHAYRWMLIRHPFHAVGCGITCVENNDFMFDANFDYYYGLGFRSVIGIVFHNLKEAQCQIMSKGVVA